MKQKNYDALKCSVLNFRESHIKGNWRLQRAIKKYNDSAERENKIELVKDISDWSKEDFIYKLRIGKKTAENTWEFVQFLKYGE